MIHHFLTTFFLPLVAFVNDPVGFTKTVIDILAEVMLS